MRVREASESPSHPSHIPLPPALNPYQQPISTVPRAPSSTSSRIGRSTSTATPTIRIPSSRTHSPRNRSCTPNKLVPSTPAQPKCPIRPRRRVRRRGQSASCEIPSGKMIPVVLLPPPAHVLGRSRGQHAVTVTMMFSSNRPCFSTPYPGVVPLRDLTYGISSRRAFTSRMRTKTPPMISSLGRDHSLIQIQVDIPFPTSSRRRMTVFRRRYRAHTYSEVEQRLTRLFSEHG